MSKGIIRFIFKVSILSLLIIVLFNLGIYLLNSKEEVSALKIPSQNKHQFKNTQNEILGNIGVAITTNIGIRYKQRTELPATIYKEVMSIGEIIGNNDIAKKDLISSNMLMVNEYLNVMKTNIKQLLENSIDRGEILNAYISGLEFRYKQASVNIVNLEKQRVVLEQVMIDTEIEIEELKIKMNTDFKSSDAGASLENIDTYLELKEQYGYARTYNIYINQFIQQYTFLNNYNTVLLDTLINNKVAIIKNAYVIVPDTGSSMLRELDLLYEEQDYKNQ